MTLKAETPELDSRVIRELRMRVVDEQGNGTTYLLVGSKDGGQPYLSISAVRCISFEEFEDLIQHGHELIRDWKRRYS